MKKLIKQLMCKHKWVSLPYLISLQRVFFEECKCSKCNKKKVKFK